MADQSNPLEDRRVRSALGLFSASIIAVVAVFFVDGMLRWLMLGIAAIDLLATPYILGLAIEQAEEEDEHSGFES